MGYATLIGWRHDVPLHHQSDQRHGHVDRPHRQWHVGHSRPCVAGRGAGWAAGDGVTRESQLIRFNTGTPGTSTTVAVDGLVLGERLAGIDWRPQTGQLFGIGIRRHDRDRVGDAVSHRPADRQATVIGAPGGIADGAGNPIDLDGRGGVRVRLRPHGRPHPDRDAQRHQRPIQPRLRRAVEPRYGHQRLTIDTGGHYGRGLHEQLRSAARRRCDDALYDRRGRRSAVHPEPAERRHPDDGGADHVQWRRSQPDVRQRLRYSGLRRCEHLEHRRHGPGLRHTAARRVERPVDHRSGHRRGHHLGTLPGRSSDSRWAIAHKWTRRRR